MVHLPITSFYFYWRGDMWWIQGLIFGYAKELEQDRNFRIPHFFYPKKDFIKRFSAYGP